jgi:hypothetical protein
MGLHATKPPKIFEEKNWCKKLLTILKKFFTAKFHIVTRMKKGFDPNKN